MTVPSMHQSELPHHLNEQAFPMPREQAVSEKHKVRKKRKKTNDTITIKKNVLKTCFKGGGGLPLQKFDTVHVEFLSIESLAFSLICPRRGARAPLERTRSLHFVESPATLPNAQTA